MTTTTKVKTTRREKKKREKNYYSLVVAEGCRRRVGPPRRVAGRRLCNRSPRPESAGRRAEAVRQPELSREGLPPSPARHKARRRPDAAPWATAATARHRPPPPRRRARAGALPRPQAAARAGRAGRRSRRSAGRSRRGRRAVLCEFFFWERKKVFTGKKFFERRGEKEKRKTPK